MQREAKCSSLGSAAPEVRHATGTGSHNVPSADMSSLVCPERCREHGNLDPYDSNHGSQ